MHIDSAEGLVDAYDVASARVREQMLALSPLVAEAYGLLGQAQSPLYGPIPALVNLTNDLATERDDVAWRIDWLQSTDAQPLGASGRVSGFVPETRDEAFARAGLTPEQIELAEQMIRDGVPFSDAVAAAQSDDPQAALDALRFAELNEKIDNWSGSDNDPILDQLLRERRLLLERYLESGEPIPAEIVEVTIELMTADQLAELSLTQPDAVRQALAAAGLDPYQSEVALNYVSAGLSFDEAIAATVQSDYDAARLVELDDEIARWVEIGNPAMVNALLQQRQAIVDRYLDSGQPIPPTVTVQLLPLLTAAQVVEIEEQNPGTIDLAYLNAVIAEHDANAFPDDPINPEIEHLRDLRDGLVAEIAAGVDGRPDNTIAAIAQRNGITYEEAELALEVTAIEELNAQMMALPSLQGRHAVRDARNELIAEFLDGDEVTAAIVGQFMSQGHTFGEALALAGVQQNQAAEAAAAAEDDGYFQDIPGGFQAGDVAAGMRDGALDGLDGLRDVLTGVWSFMSTAVTNPGEIDDMISDKIDEVTEVIDVLRVEIEAGNWDTVVVEFLLPMLGIEEDLINEHGLDYGIGYAIASNPDLLVGGGGLLLKLADGINDLRKAGRLNPTGNNRRDVDVNTRTNGDSPTIDLSGEAARVQGLDMDKVDVDVDVPSALAQAAARPTPVGDRPLVSSAVDAGPPGDSGPIAVNASPNPPGPGGDIDYAPTAATASPSRRPDHDTDFEPAPAMAEPPRKPNGDLDPVSADVPEPVLVSAATNTPDRIDITSPDRQPALVGANNMPDVNANTPNRTPEAATTGGSNGGGLGADDFVNDGDFGGPDDVSIESSTPNSLESNGAKPGKALDEESLRTGEVRMLDHPDFEVKVADLEAKGYSVDISSSHDYPSVTIWETVELDGSYSVDLVVQLPPDIRYLDFEHELIHIENFERHGLVTDRRWRTQDGTLDTSRPKGAHDPSPNFLKRREAAVEELYTRLVEYRQLSDRGAAQDLLDEHALGIAHFENEAYHVLRNKGDWVMRNYPELDGLANWYSEAR